MSQIVCKYITHVLSQPNAAVRELGVLGALRFRCVRHEQPLVVAQIARSESLFGQDFLLLIGGQTRRYLYQKE